MDPEAAETIPETAAVVLGDTLPSPDDPVPESNVKRASSAVPGNAGGSPNGEEAFDLASHPDIRKTIDKDLGDRSADTQRIVGACFRAGLRLPQIRWAVNQRPDLVERLEERADDDVCRMFLKLANTDQQKKAAAHGANDIEAFDAEVAREHRTLRVREEARRRLAAEKEDATKPFDAGLLEDILARPPEPPFRIEGLLPSRAGCWSLPSERPARRRSSSTWLAACSRGKGFLAGLRCDRWLGRSPSSTLKYRVPSWRGGPTRSASHEIDCSW